MASRIPFQIAVSEPMLLKPHWDTLSFAQQAILLAAYGCPLDSLERDDRGWTRLDYFWASQGHGKFDSLGYLIDVHHPGPYIPKDYPEVWCIAGVRSGKALALDTTIPTTSGWTTMGDVSVGDVLFGRDGRPTTVTWIGPVWTDHSCYRLTLSDGESIVADAGHKWLVNDYRKRKVGQHDLQVRTTQELVDDFDCKQRRWAIPVADPVDLPAVDLPVDPYVLGVWLGDGSSYKAEVTTADPEVLQEIEKAGFTVTSRGLYAWGISGARLHDRSQSLRTQLRLLGVLGNKHIPLAYLRGSIDQRLSLLAGLIDTDGYVTERGGVEFYNTNRRLAEQVREVVASLGMRPTLREKDAQLNGRIVGKVYTVSFQPRFPCARLPRKAARMRVGWGPCRMWRYITAIEPVDPVPVRCLAVDGADHTFLVGPSYTPTHNSDQVSATANVYEALCGGHEDRIRPGKQGYILLVAQNLRQSRAAIHSITATLRTIPWLSDDPSNRLENPWVPDGRRWEATADRVDLWNGMCILATPPTVKAIRGFDSPSGLLDEVGVWPTESEKVNVDEEIYDQITSRQAQFINTKLFAISSPWIMSGMLYKRALAGTGGSKLVCGKCDTLRPEERPPACAQCEEVRVPFQDLLVLHMPTAAMGNPLVTHEFLVRKRNRNPQKFARECLAIFQPSSDGFLDPARVDAAIDRGRSKDLPPQHRSATNPTQVFYVAAMDPAFRQDDFTFAIGHIGGDDKLIIDLIRAWTPPPGGSLSPENILNEIVVWLRQYGINHVLSDQHSFPALEQLAQDRGFFLEPVQFTGTSKNNLYGNLQNLLYQGRLSIPEDPDLVAQLKSLQRTYGAQNRVSISAPPGMHDDMATVVALVASRAVYMLPEAAEETVKPKSTHDYCMETVARKRAAYKALYD